MAKIGRKTKLTPELQEEIIKYIEAGNYAKDACKAVGIGRSTYYYWKEQGEKAEKKLEEGKKLSDKENEFLDFLDTTRQAEAEGELNIFLEICQQVKKDWRAGMEILGRKYPKRWGRKEMRGGIKDSPIEI